MMYAEVKDGVVTNLVEATEEVALQRNLILVDVLDHVNIGDFYFDGQFVLSIDNIANEIMDKKLFLIDEAEALFTPSFLNNFTEEQKVEINAYYQSLHAVDPASYSSVDEFLTPDPPECVVNFLRAQDEQGIVHPIPEVKSLI